MPDEYSRQIDALERNFFIHPDSGQIARMMKWQLLEFVFEYQGGKWLQKQVFKESTADPNNANNVDSDRARDHIRNIIAESGILPTSVITLRDQYIEPNPSAIYDKIKTVVLRSNLVPSGQRVPGITYAPYTGNSPFPISGTREEVCVSRGMYMNKTATWRCDQAMEVIRIRERRDFIGILENVWQFDIQLEESAALGPSAIWGLKRVPVKHVRLRRRSQAEGMVASPNRLPTTHETNRALTRGFVNYLRRQGVSAVRYAS